MAQRSSSTTIGATPVSSNGHTTRAAMTVAGPTRRRPTWALLGVGLVVLAMLVGAWVFATRSRSISVVVADRDIAAGQVITSGDLRVVELSRTGGLRAVQPADQARLVGRAARGPIPAGTVLNTGLVAESAAVVPAGQIVVGVALEPGASPSSRLSAGDRVEVLMVARTATGSTANAAPATVLTAGLVWAVEPIGTGASSSGKVWVSLLVPQATHVEVAQAAADGRLRLGLLGAGS